MISRLLLALSLAASDDPAPRLAPLPPLPSATQLAWHDLEFYAFVHFNMNTFTDREWGEGTEDAKLFNPSALDCRQWARVAKDAGMKAIILTAKHHDGFCLWPSQYTEHSVKNSAWKDGKGDVLRELSNACREAGLKFGVYLSPWDRNQPCYGDTPKYNDFFVNQLTEVLTHYGDVFEVWFDGACGEGPNGKKQVYDWPRFIATVRKHQPNAVIFSDAGPDIRWVGNENGFAGETCYAMLRRDEFYPGIPDATPLTEGQLEGTHWLPAECDVSIRPGWYYHADQDDKVKTVEQLAEIWYRSAGHGASLLLNLPVDRRGLVHENDARRLMEFKAFRDSIFANDLADGATATSDDARQGYPADALLDSDAATFFAGKDGVRSATIAIDLGKTMRFDHLELGEHIALGQRVTRFHIEAEVDDKFRTIGSATTIGRKRILKFEPLAAQRLRIVIDDARAAPTLSRFLLYASPSAR